MQHAMTTNGCCKEKNNNHNNNNEYQLAHSTDTSHKWLKEKVNNSYKE